MEELLCFGWIDILPRALDAERTMLLSTSRKPKSAWSKANRERVQRLQASGLMELRGLEVAEEAKRTGAWSKLVSAGALEEPTDLKNQVSRLSGRKRKLCRLSPFRKARNSSMSLR